MACRLCFVELNKNIVETLSTASDGELILHEMIHAHFQLTLSQTESILDQICGPCWRNLNSFHQFCVYVEQQQIAWQQGELDKATLSSIEELADQSEPPIMDDDDPPAPQLEIEIGPEGPIEIKNELDADTQFLSQSLQDDTIKDSVVDYDTLIQTSEIVAVKKIEIVAVEGVAVNKTQNTTTISETLPRFENIKTEPVMDQQDSEQLQADSKESVISLSTTDISKTILIDKTVNFELEDKPEEFDETAKFELEENPEEFADTPTTLIQYKLNDIEKSHELMAVEDNFNPSNLANNQSSVLTPVNILSNQPKNPYQIFTILELENNINKRIDKSNDLPTDTTCSAKIVSLDRSGNLYKTEAGNLYGNVANFVNLNCNICGAPMETFDKLRQHCKVVHESIRTSCTDKDYFICELCNTAFTEIEFLNDHMRVKHASCSICNKQFATKVARDGHIKAKHNSEMSLNCPHCPQVFQSMTDTYVHISLCHMEEWIKTNQPNTFTSAFTTNNTKSKPKRKKISY